MILIACPLQIRAILTESVSPESHRTVESILEQVHKLSTLDKLLLYLKLPTGRPAEACDPLRQPLNPLGSRSGQIYEIQFSLHLHCLCRSEIQLTINWIRSHYEEDPQVRDWQCTFETEPLYKSSLGVSAQARGV